MKHEAVTSSNLASVAHDPATKTLEVCFKNGGTYRYEGVSSEEHQALIKAPSCGSHFMKHIRPKYQGKKV
jgi:hypothetical protein